MSIFLKTLSLKFAVGLIAIAGFISGHTGQPLGATNPVPTAVSFFSTQLAAPITATASSMTLVSGVDSTGTALASSTYAFVIDGGTTQQEVVLADCTGTSCTNMQRGIDPLTGAITVASLEFTHRRGASIDITDAPYLLILNRTISGVAPIYNPLYYSSAITNAQLLASTTALVNVSLLNATAAAGCVPSSEVASGCAQLATGAQASSGTSAGSSGQRLVISSSISTSTCQVPQNSNLITSASTGKLTGTCFDTGLPYTFTGLNTFSASTTFASTTFVGSTTFSGIANFSGGTTGLAPASNVSTFLTGAAITANDAVAVSDIMIDATSTNTTGGSQASPWTFSFTTGTGPNRDMVIAFACQSATGVSATYNGVASTAIGNAGTSGNTQWVMNVVAPASGTHNVVITYSSCTDPAAVIATYVGVNQTTPVEAMSTGTFVSTTPTESIQPLTVGALAVLALGGVQQTSGTNFVWRGDPQGYDGNSSVSIGDAMPNGWVGAASVTQSGSGSGTGSFTQFVLKPAGTPVIEDLHNGSFDGRNTFIGFANTTGAASTTLNVTTSGVASGFANLVPGLTYYASNVPAAIVSTSTTALYSAIKVGRAASPTSLLVTNNW